MRLLVLTRRLQVGGWSGDRRGVRRLAGLSVGNNVEDDVVISDLRQRWQ